MILMSVIFAVIYPMTISRVGYLYNDTILVPKDENGTTVYSGKIDGTQVQFIVAENQSVVLQYGDKTYGPYTIKKDPTAVPKNEEAEGYMTGASKSVMETGIFSRRRFILRRRLLAF